MYHNQGLLLFLAICQKLKILWHFEIFLTQDYIGLEISKRYSSHNFHPMSVKRYEDIGYYGGIQAMISLGNRPIFKYFLTLWNFNMGSSQWENLKCKISQKRLIVEWNGRKFGTWGTMLHLCRVPLMSDSLSLLWGHSVRFAKCLILQFSKRYLSNNFHQIPFKLYESIAYGGMQAITLLRNRPSFTKVMAIWNFNIGVNGKT